MSQPLVISPMQQFEPFAIQGRCATCRWAAEEMRDWYDGWTENLEGRFTLICGAIARDNDRPDALAQCLSEDPQGYVGVHVSPAFGCVMWEAKP